MTDDPGIVSPDGSPVDIYRALPEPADLETVAAAIPSGASILDLGAGTGRFARPLAARGHAVTAVDNEPAMLAGLETVAGLTPIVGEIGALRLEGGFDVVLLASHLIDDDDLGPRALDVAIAHLAPGGLVIGEVYPVDLDWESRVGHRGVLGPVGITITRARRDGDMVDAEVRYDLDGRTWDQPFVTRILDPAALEERLAGAGLRFDRWLDDSRGWFVARP